MSRGIQRVRFGEDVDGESKNSILVEVMSGDLVKINLGFLKLYHIYRVEIIIPDSILALGTLHDMNLVANSQFCTLKSWEHKAPGFVMVIELRACQNNQILEELVFQNTNRLLRFIINAAVLGPTKGTPLLKDGIHLVGKITKEGSSDEEDEDTTMK